MILANLILGGSRDYIERLIKSIPKEVEVFKGDICEVEIDG